MSDCEQPESELPGMWERADFMGGIEVNPLPSEVPPMCIHLDLCPGNHHTESSSFFCDHLNHCEGDHEHEGYTVALDTRPLPLWGIPGRAPEATDNG